MLMKFYMEKQLILYSGPLKPNCGGAQLINRSVSNVSCKLNDYIIQGVIDHKVTVCGINPNIAGKLNVNIEPIEKCKVTTGEGENIVMVGKFRGVIALWGNDYPTEVVVMDGLRDVLLLGKEFCAHEQLVPFLGSSLPVSKDEKPLKVCQPLSVQHRLLNSLVTEQNSKSHAFHDLLTKQKLVNHTLVTKPDSLSKIPQNLLAANSSIFPDLQISGEIKNPTCRLQQNSVTTHNPIFTQKQNLTSMQGIVYPNPQNSVTSQNPSFQQLQNSAAIQNPSFQQLQNSAAIQNPSFPQLRQQNSTTAHNLTFPQVQASTVTPNPICPPIQNSTMMNFVLPLQQNVTNIQDPIVQVFQKSVNGEIRSFQVLLIPPKSIIPCNCPYAQLHPCYCQVEGKCARCKSIHQEQQTLTVKEARRIREKIRRKLNLKKPKRKKNKPDVQPNDNVASSAAALVALGMGTNLINNGNCHQR